MLDLEVSVVEQFLLALLLDLEFGNVGLQVPASRQSARDISYQIGLISSQLEQLLRLFEQLFFLRPDFLLDLIFHLLGLLILILGELVHLLQLFLSRLLLSESFLSCGEFFLRCVETLHLLSQDGVDRCDVGAFVVQLSGEGGKLVPKDCYLTIK